jgi:hypothetical protein
VGRKLNKTQKNNKGKYMFSGVIEFIKIWWLFITIALTIGFMFLVLKEEGL